MSIPNLFAVAWPSRSDTGWVYALLKPDCTTELISSTFLTTQVKGDANKNFCWETGNMVETVGSHLQQLERQKSLCLFFLNSWRFQWEKEGSVCEITRKPTELTLAHWRSDSTHVQCTESPVYCSTDPYKRPPRSNYCQQRSQTMKKKVFQGHVAENQSQDFSLKQYGLSPVFRNITISDIRHQ